MMTPQRARVELRTPTPADRDEFLAAMRASAKLHRPWLQSPVTPEAYDRLLARAADDRYDPLFVCLRDEGPIVGFFNISEIVRASSRARSSATARSPRTRATGT
jgi:[ribosomal protein S5]-alanine N-acetyltransferase